MAGRPLAITVLIVVAVVLCLVVLVPVDRNTVEGIVAHKAVTGAKDNTSYTILMNYSYAPDGEPRILVKDEDYETYFSTRGENAVVSEWLESEMKRKYSVVDYFVNVRVGPEDEGTQPYRVSREFFNNMEVGTWVKFRWSWSTELPEMVELLASTDGER